MARFFRSLTLEDVLGTSQSMRSSISPEFVTRRVAVDAATADDLPSVSASDVQYSRLPAAARVPDISAFSDGWGGNRWTEKPGNEAPAGGTPPDTGITGRPDGVGNPGNGNGGVGNPDPGGDNPGNGNGGQGNPDAGGPGNGNGGEGNPDAGGPGNGHGGEGNPNPGGGGSDKPGAPTPPDVLLLDIDTADYVADYTFLIDDVSGGFDGSTFATDPSIINLNVSKETKEGVTLYAIDSEFGFYTTDFVGAQSKVRDNDYGEGWAGNLTGSAVAAIQ